jgi:ribosomal protein L39E
MFLNESEYISVIVDSIKRKSFVEKILNRNDIILGQFYNIHWTLLKTSTYRKNKINVKCDDCQNIFMRRLRDLNENNNIHYCNSCRKKGNRNSMYGKSGESHPLYGIERPWQKGENNPAKNEAVKKKISDKNKGKPSSMLGKHHTEETKRKQSESNKNKKRSIETIEKIRIARRKQTGSKCPGWKGGITKETIKTRNSHEYRKWRNSVLKRDEKICRKCGSNNKLNAHHINSFSENKDLIFETNNGITLCNVCHNNFHKMYGYKNFPNIIELDAI